jgi:hypothetical protein
LHLLSSMTNPGPQSVTAYRVKTPIVGRSGKFLIHTVIPAGSTVEWQTGDYESGMASVYWARRRVLIMESDLFKHCERVLNAVSPMGEGASRLTGPPPGIDSLSRGSHPPKLHPKKES